MNDHILEWVKEVSKKTHPTKIIWCDGSEDQFQSLVKMMVKEGDLIEFDQMKFPGCYLHRSNPNDVARTENLTFICTKTKDDAGPTNNWISPDEAEKKVSSLFESCMKGRTMYVIPYILGPLGSRFTQSGVQITDSAYVVANQQIMARIGNVALEHMKESENFVRGLHSIGDMNPKRRYICHFPEEKLILSIGSGYGGNALLSKKCHALRIASVVARDEGWLAEHMLIIGIQDPTGRITYMTGAFPSACGKTTIALLKPPASYKSWNVWTIGDDIAWLRQGFDGRLWAINPETGIFGIVSGVNEDTNPNAKITIGKNTIFTNVAMTLGRTPWWTDMDRSSPIKVLNWKGKEWVPGDGEPTHPNARFTTRINQCPSILPTWDDPKGKPISAIILGGRRSRVAPLVYEAFDWNHGVFIGSMMGSETTVAATGDVGILRRDPMAMIPFCGYNMADYFNHWIKLGSRLSNPPKIFHVNWFKKNEDGDYVWPGFKENIRVLRWITERINGYGEAIKTALGYVPSKTALDIKGLGISDEDMEELLKVNHSECYKDLESTAEFFKEFGDRLPEEMWKQYLMLKSRLS